MNKKIQYRTIVSVLYRLYFLPCVTMNNHKMQNFITQPPVLVERLACIEQLLSNSLPDLTLAMVSRLLTMTGTHRPDTAEDTTASI